MQLTPAGDNLNGTYTFPNKNGDYAFQITASDAAGRTLNKTINVKSRNWDVNRDTSSDGKVNIFDIISLTQKWNTNDPQYDLAAPEGIINIFDLLVITNHWAP